MHLSNQDTLISEIHIDQFDDYLFCNPIIYDKDTIRKTSIVSTCVFSILNTETQQHYNFKILTFYNASKKQCFSYCVELGLSIYSSKHILSSIEGVISCVLRYLQLISGFLLRGYDVKHFYTKTHNTNIYDTYYNIASSHLNEVFFPMKSLNISKQRILQKTSQSNLFILDDYQVYALKGKRILEVKQ